MFAYILYIIGQWVALTLPVRLGYRLAVFLARIKFVLAKKERVFIANNLNAILGENNPELSKYARAMYENFSKYLIDFFRSPKLDKQFIEKFVQLDGLENMDEPLKKGVGAIGLSAHIGNWELCGQVLAILGYKVNAIALTHKNKSINNFFIEQRKKKGVNVVPIGIALRQCFYALKHNEIVGVLGDRDFSGANGVFVDFFDRKTLIPRGPAILSLRTGAAIVPTFIIRDVKNERYFRFVSEKPIYPVKTNNEEQDIKNLTEKFTKVIEKYVEQYPEQWFMFREFWKPEKVEIL